MKMKKTVTPVCSAFIRKDGKYLITYDPRFDFWRVPGGKLKFNEKVEDALIREMLEEFDIKIKINKFLGFGQDTVVLKKEVISSRVILYFECEIVSGEVKIMEPAECTELKFVSLSALKKMKPLEPALIDFFKRCEQQTQFLIKNLPR
jgi:ADP-ribose pyrophosphatase YjhB (NUDIX family)